jgi:hypothetical protein
MALLKAFGMPESRLANRRSTQFEREMAKISPDKGRTNKKKAAGAADLTEKKAPASQTQSSPLTWSHRTPRGLHASEYMKG